MAIIALTPEQLEHTEWICQVLRQATDADLRNVATLLASSPGSHCSGRPNSRSAIASARSTPRRSRSPSTSDKGGYRGSSLCCPHCREAARFVGYRPKGLVSLLGQIRPERSCYPL